MLKFEEGYQAGQARAHELIEGVKARASFHNGWNAGFKDAFDEAWAEYPESPENLEIREMLYDAQMSEE
jgi:ribosome modulation factor